MMQKASSRPRRLEALVLGIATCLLIVVACVTLWPPQALAGWRQQLSPDVMAGLDRMTAAAGLASRLGQQRWAASLSFGAKHGQPSSVDPRWSTGAASDLRECFHDAEDDAPATIEGLIASELPRQAGHHSKYPTHHPGP